MAAQNILKGIAASYPDSLDDDPSFQTISGLNEWIAETAGLLGASISASDKIPREGGTKPVPPLKSYHGNLFGSVLGEGQQMYASGSGMDCAIHSFLTSVSSNFRGLDTPVRNKIASHFRRQVMPRLSDVQREIERQMNVGGDHIVDDLEEDFLSDDMGAVLATRFNIGILVIKKTYPFSFNFANEFQKDENGEEMYERNQNGNLIMRNVESVNSASGRVGIAKAPVPIPTNFTQVVVHHSTMGHWTPIKFGNTYFVSRADVVQAREHFWRVAQVAENQHKGSKAVPKAATTASAATAATKSNTWDCTICTYANPQTAKQCELCNAAKPSIKVQEPVLNSPKAPSSALAKLQAAREALQAKKLKNTTLTSKEENLSFLDAYNNNALRNWAIASGRNLNEIRKRLGRNKTQKIAQVNKPKNNATHKNNKALAATVIMPNLSKLSLKNKPKNNATKKLNAKTMLAILKQKVKNKKDKNESNAKELGITVAELKKIQGRE